MLIREISNLKTYLGRAISQATTFAFIESYVQLAQDEFIRPAIGPELLAELEQQYNSPDASALTADNRLLLGLVQRALAFYTYWKYLPFSLGSDGDAGLQEQNSDNSKPVRMAVLELRQNESIKNACLALEQVLVHLFAHADRYPTWAASAVASTTRAMFLPSATALTEYEPQIAGSYRLFLTLRPYILLAERNKIVPLIGQATFDALRAVLQTPLLLSTQDVALLRPIRAALAACAYRDALFHLNVVQTAGGGLRVLSEFDGIHNAKAVDSAVLADAQARADARAGQLLNSCKKFIEDHADDYPAYKVSPLYRTKKPNDLPDNKQYIGVFRMR